MNADRVINKINHDMNAFNESGGREDKTCAEGLRIARTYIQQEVLKRKILTHDQQVVLEWLKEETQKTDDSPFKVTHRFFTEKLHKRLPRNIYFSYLRLNDEQQIQVLAAFAEWGSKEEQS